MIDLHKLIGLDDKKMPKMEKTGERTLRDMKEWMLRERSSKECATLPEDTIMVSMSKFVYKLFVSS